ncbi:uncharacterized protein LOC121249464 [Juglans microcarpa x Juglans regia]|uniref:uncharacterized protein LOC121249464 n=1 Tax=Juglans microcarpa x Juglans regia TaxID=2249226 RepID=UPI001B7F4472|nr:uncharacterized protein LOC121249464 [Juglans microcarpa x Juglans regia]
MERDLEGETSSRSRDKLVWKTLWKLEVAPATMMFIWRAYSEALPTLANLRRRKIVEDNSCFICKQVPETSGYALWGCAAAQDVWNLGGKKMQKMTFHSEMVFDIWSILVDLIDSTELKEVAAILRGIWTRRNEFLHGKEFKHPTMLCQQTKAELLSHTKALKESREISVKSPAMVHKWSKPAEDCFKIHGDAAVKTGVGRIGI